MPNEPGDLPPLPSPERLRELMFDAAQLGRTDVLPALLHAGCAVEAKDERGYTRSSWRPIMGMTRPWRCCSITAPIPRRVMPRAAIPR
jgi:hypothetical protein